MKKQWDHEDPKHIYHKFTYIGLQYSDPTIGPSCYEYNDKMEEYIRFWLKTLTNLPELVHSGMKGWHPFYDAIMLDENNSTVEIKTSLSHKPFLETSRADGSQSGLSITTAHYYLFVSPGWSKCKPTDQLYTEVGKFRLVLTEDLHKYKEEHKDEIYTKESTSGPDCKGLDINFRLLPHKYIGDFPLLYFNEKLCGFDLGVNSNDIKVFWEYKK